MKKMLVILSLALSSISLAYDDYDIDEEVDAQGFIVGSDQDLGGAFFYIVDKTNGLCFAGINHGVTTGGGGLSPVNCDQLKNTPKIQKYLRGEKID